MLQFTKEDLKKLYVPPTHSKGEDNGQVAIIGGSTLFHGAPLLSLKVASRICDMVFFSSPEKSLEDVSSQMKSQLLSFIWTPWQDVEEYIQKSDAVLIGPGFMRFSSERVPHGDRTHVCDEACQFTRSVTKELLTEHPDKRWVIDAGSLQTMVPQWIPQHAILTPNQKEYSLLFSDMETEDAAKEFNCIIVRKGPITTVTSASQKMEIHGGNPGLTKGGTGDVQAGLTAALLAKNDPFLAACAAAFLVKASAENLFQKVGLNYNADDLASEIPGVYHQLITS